MKNILAFLIIGILGCRLTMAQGLIQWQNTIAGNHDDLLTSSFQTADGGYILGGYSSSNIAGDKTESSLGNYDYWVIKLDTAGAIQWQNTIGGSDVDYLRSMKQTTDGGYILGGMSLSNTSGDKTENCLGNYDFWVIKLDAAGTIQWQNTIGGSDEDDLYCLAQTSDGGFILGGCSKSNISGDKTENSQGDYDNWIVKLDAAGNIQWQNTIGGSGTDWVADISTTSDGGFVVGGFSTSNISGDKTENCLGPSDYWFIKLDSLGNIQWQNTIGGNGADYLYSFIQTMDGGYFLGGTSYSNISGDKTESNWDTTMITADYWVLKLDATGNIQWQNTIGGDTSDNLSCVIQTTDGGYCLGGSSKSNISGDKTEDHIGGNGAISVWEDYWVIKLDASGNIQWQNTIGGSYQDILGDVTQTADGGYFLGGWSFSNISGDKTENNSGQGPEYWVLKLYPDGFLPVVTPLSVTHGIFVFPNPFSKSTSISFSLSRSQNVSLKIFDTNGKLVSTLADEFFESGENEIAWDVVDVNPGIYILYLHSDELSQKTKVIVTR